MKEENEFISSFLCVVAMIAVKLSEFITDILGVSRYLEKDRNGIINNIIKAIFVIIVTIPMFIFVRYLKIDNKSNMYN